MSNFVFNFQKRFADAVERGAKRQTIRAMRKDGRLPKVGDVAKCFTGMRTKQCRLLITGDITRVRRIRFDLKTGKLYFGNVRLQGLELVVFAKMDGFASFEEMWDWFKQNHRGDEFRGVCTEWIPAA